MSNPELQEVARLERVPEIDDGTLLRIRQVRPVEKAASPIIDHNLELIELAVGLRKWYQGKGVSTPHDLLGDSLDPHENNACNMLNDFVGTVKRFKPGAFPAHCDAVRELEFTTVRLIRTLMEICDAPVFVEAIKRVGILFATLADPINFTLSDHDFQQRLNSRLANLTEAFAEISRVFKKRERERDFEIVFRKLPPEPATKEEVRAIVKRAAGSAADKIVSSTERAADKVAAAVEKGAAKMMRAVGKKKGRKPRIKVDVQEAVWNIHEREKRNEEVRNMGHGHATRENEFIHAQRELKTFGILTAKAYVDLLNMRTKRHSRAAAKPLN